MVDPRRREEEILSFQAGAHGSMVGAFFVTEKEQKKTNMLSG